MNKATNTFAIPQLDTHINNNLPGVMEAFNNGEIKLRRSLTYRSKKADTGFVFYQIKFKQGKKNQVKTIYNGAYQISLEYEKYLTDRNKLNDFLLRKLTETLIA